MNLHVKKGDSVVVLAGKDKGKTGKIVSCNRTDMRVTVEGVNIVTKHKKPRSAQVPGGIFKNPAPIDVSNVMIICPACSKATRVAASEVGGKKIRVCKKCNASLEVAVKADKKAKKAAKAKAEEKAVKEEAAVVEKKTAAKKPVAKKTEDTAEKKPAAKKAATKKEEKAE